jgi:hypothetical protein
VLTLDKPPRPTSDRGSRSRWGRRAARRHDARDGWLRSRNTRRSVKAPHNTRCAPVRRQPFSSMFSAVGTNPDDPTPAKRARPIRKGRNLGPVGRDLRPLARLRASLVSEASVVVWTVAGGIAEHVVVPARQVGSLRQPVERGQGLVGERGVADAATLRGALDVPESARSTTSTCSDQRMSRHRSAMSSPRFREPRSNQHRVSARRSRSKRRTSVGCEVARSRWQAAWIEREVGTRPPLARRTRSVLSCRHHGPREGPVRERWNRRWLSRKAGRGAGGPGLAGSSGGSRVKRLSRAGIGQQSPGVAPAEPPRGRLASVRTLRWPAGGCAA